jgi:ferredoxin-NADP reductase
MPIYQITFLQHQTIAQNTQAFYFSKPEGFSFKAGQYAGFTVMKPTKTDGKGNNRRITIASCPADDYLMIALRMRDSAFKQYLTTLQTGDLIKMAGPAGNFVLPDDTTMPIVMIAGGIGITPFYSMLKQAFTTSCKHPIYLFYANRTIADAAFYQDLQAIDHQQFQFIPIFTQENASWQGEKEYINEKMLQRYLNDIHQAKYYICGTPQMVIDTKAYLKNLNIDDLHLYIEDFAGYTIIDQ